MSNFKLGNVTVMTDGFISVPELEEPVILFGTEGEELNLYTVTESVYNKSKFNVGDIISFVIEDPLVLTTTINSGNKSMPVKIIVGCSYVKRYKRIKK